MQVTVKVKYGTDNPRIEGFGNNRYLVYVSASKEDVEGTYAELAALLSKRLGVPPDRVQLKREMDRDTKVFDIG